MYMSRCVGLGHPASAANRGDAAARCQAREERVGCNTGLASLASCNGSVPLRKISRAMNERQDLHSRFVNFVNQPVPMDEKLSNRWILQLGHNPSALTHDRK